LVYKTTNGGKNWKQIYYQDGYYFYGNSILYNNAIFGTIKNPEDISKENLFKLDLTTQKFTLLNTNNANVESVGGYIWISGDSIYTYFTKNTHRGILITDTDFSSFLLKPFNYITRDGVIVSDSVYTYFITWKNQLVVENNGKYTEVAIKEPACITKNTENKVLIATQEQENAINLYQFDTTNDKLEKLQTFENYSIISHLQSNEKVIIGFMGNIKGLFVEYDLIYSTDKGQTWQIQKLKEKKLITPNCLVDNILYIYSGIKLQKITF
jgi:hypothetical protein